MTEKSTAALWCSHLNTTLNTALVYTRSVSLLLSEIILEINGNVSFGS